jgi:hypothetical protein
MSEPTATYDPALVTDLDWMRSRLGDTDTTAPVAPDATYLAYLTAADDNWRLGAAALARSFAADAARKAQSIQGDPGSISWGDRSGKWLKIAAELEAEASRLGIGSGALWVADVERSDLMTDVGEYSVALRRS